MSEKIYPDATAALAGLIEDGQTLAVGGFGLCGIPEALIAALRDSGVKNVAIALRKSSAGVKKAEAEKLKVMGSPRLQNGRT